MSRKPRGSKIPVPHFRKIDFDQEFKRGRRAYDDRAVGRWWRQRSEDRSHARAYRTIARFIQRLRLPGRPTVVDYACGHGSMLVRLFRVLPGARLVGVDGSKLQLEMARRRLIRLDRRAMDRVELIETKLPDFTLPRGMADLAVFVFPNLVANETDQPYFDKHGYKHPRDSVVGRQLAKLREENPDDETCHTDPDLVYDELMTNRVVARNIRGLVKTGGLCVRVEYSNSIREGLTQLVQDRTAFEEGSLTRRYGGKRPDRFFEYLFNDYHRSKVIEDVYHQTGEEDDKEGGYLIGVLRAV